MQQVSSTKSIVHVVCNFGFSGAHVFAVNLANEQVKTYNVTVLNMDPSVKPDPLLLSRIDPQVRIINLTINRLLKKVIYRIGNLMTGMEKNSPFYSSVVALKMIKLLKGADIVHTHFVRDRFFVSKALTLIGRNAPKHVMTDHGGFLEIEEKFQGKIPKQFGKRVFDSIVRSCSYIATISDAQDSFWQKKEQEGYSIKFNKIYNGNPFVIKNPATREELGCTSNDFIFVMVARGSEPSKGWELTIKAFLKNNDPGAKLILIGEGREIDRLKLLYVNNSNITFTGSVKNPADYLHLADAGVLASTYSAESLPNSIIEYLQAGKPVIGSDIGEIKNMLRIGQDDAGILLPIERNSIDVDLYATAMNKMQHDKAAYNYFKQNAIKAAKQYDISYCAHRYETEVYGFAEKT